MLLLKTNGPKIALGDSRVDDNAIVTIKHKYGTAQNTAVVTSIDLTDSSSGNRNGYYTFVNSPATYYNITLNFYTAASANGTYAFTGEIKGYEASNTLGLTDGTNKAYGFYSGTNRYNFFAAGNANYFYGLTEHAGGVKLNLLS